MLQASSLSSAQPAGSGPALVSAATAARHLHLTCANFAADSAGLCPGQRPGTSTQVPGRWIANKWSTGPTHLERRPGECNCWVAGKQGRQSSGGGRGGPGGGEWARGGGKSAFTAGGLPNTWCAPLRALAGPAAPASSCRRRPPRCAHPRSHEAAPVTDACASRCTRHAAARAGERVVKGRRPTHPHLPGCSALELEMLGWAAAAPSSARGARTVRAGGRRWPGPAPVPSPAAGLAVPGIRTGLAERPRPLRGCVLALLDGHLAPQEPPLWDHREEPPEQQRPGMQIANGGSGPRAGAETCLSSLRPRSPPSS